MIKKLLFVSLVLLSVVQISFAQKATSAAKKKLAAELTAQTMSIYPIEFFEDSFAKLNAERSAELEKSIADDLFGKLERANMTANERDILKSRIASFSRGISAWTRDTLMKELNIRNQVNKSSEKRYLQVFTLAELQKLNKFFKTSDGQAFVKKFNQLVTGELEAGGSTSSNADEKDLENIGIALGEKMTFKFLDLLVLPVMDDINKYIEDWRKRITVTFESETTKDKIRKEVEKFLAENSAI